MSDILVVSGLPDTKTGYWGDVDATIEWCERNYVVTPYVAEWWNTVTSLVVLAGGTRVVQRGTRLQRSDNNDSTSLARTP